MTGRGRLTLMHIEADGKCFGASLNKMFVMLLVDTYAFIAITDM
jgi:hypothetical protein